MGEFLVLIYTLGHGEYWQSWFWCNIIGDNAGSPSSFLFDMSYFWFHVLFCLGRSDLQDPVKVLSSYLKPTFGYGLGCHGPDHISCRQPHKRERVLGWGWGCIATSNWNWKRQMWFGFEGVIHYCMVVSWSPLFVGGAFYLYLRPYTTLIGARSLPLFLPLFRSRCKDLTLGTSRVSHVFKFIIIFALCLSISEAHMWGTFPKCEMGLDYCLIMGPLFCEHGDPS